MWSWKAMHSQDKFKAIALGGALQPVKYQDSNTKCVMLGQRYSMNRLRGQDADLHIWIFVSGSSAFTNQ